jgi:hypothetical protein
LDLVPDEGIDTVRIIPVFIILVVLLITVVSLPFLLSPPSPSEDLDNYPSHTRTILIESTNSTFHLCVDYYLRESEVGTIESRLLGTTYFIEPFDDTESVGYLYNLPPDITVLWIESYIEESDDVRVTSHVEIGVEKTVSLPGCSFSILITQWHGE